MMQKLEEQAGHSFVDLDEILKNVGFQGTTVERRAFRETLAKHAQGLSLIHI